MIYEAILYQGMTIDLNTQRKHTHAWTHTIYDTDDHTHKSDTICCFMLTYPIYLSFTLINTKTHNNLIWIWWVIWLQHCTLFKIPWMLERTFCKSMLSLFHTIAADSSYFLTVVLSIDCHRGLWETQRQCNVSVLLFEISLYHFGLSTVLVCLGKVSWQTACMLCFITPPAAGSLYIALPVKS